MGFAAETAGQGRKDVGDGGFLQQLIKQRRMPRGSACGDVGLSHPLR
jgi:hypothetical protein